MINIIANFVGKRLQQDWGEEVFFSSVASLEEVPTWPQGNSKHTSVFQTQMIYDSQTQSIVFHVLTFFRVDTNI